MSRTSLTPEQRTLRARATAYDKLTPLSALGAVGMISVAGWWPVIALGAMVVTGNVIIVCWSLRGTKPKDRPAIIAALAELFRWWRLR